MSNSDQTPPDKTPEPFRQETQRRSGCLTALMAIFGIIMLLPGLCALLFGGISVFGGGGIQSGEAPLVFLGLLVGIFGVALIWAAIKGRRS
jgi:hypothetical protein